MYSVTLTPIAALVLVGNHSYFASYTVFLIDLITTVHAVYNNVGLHLNSLQRLTGTCNLHVKSMSRSHETHDIMS